MNTAPLGGVPNDPVMYLIHQMNEQLEPLLAFIGNEGSGLMGDIMTLHKSLQGVADKLDDVQKGQQAMSGQMEALQTSQKDVIKRLERVEAQQHQCLVEKADAGQKQTAWVRDQLTFIVKQPWFLGTIGVILGVSLLPGVKQLVGVLSFILSYWQK